MRPAVLAPQLCPVLQSTNLLLHILCATFDRIPPPLLEAKEARQGFRPGPARPLQVAVRVCAATQLRAAQHNPHPYAPGGEVGGIPLAAVGGRHILPLRLGDTSAPLTEGLRLCRVRGFGRSADRSNAWFRRASPPSTVHRATVKRPRSEW